ncbi:MAG: endonuclease [Flavobacteriaceae bacterium]|nr:endonuclease [Flavobacteriaceae bacterium]
MNKSPSVHSVAFYNLENLFNTTNDKGSLDRDFTPRGKKNWTRKRYDKKIYKLGRVIASIGKHKTGGAPAIVGVAEVENHFVLKDLANSKYLKKHGFQVIHFDSPDERGIDTGLLYQPKFFQPIHSDILRLELIEHDGVQDHTRDILYVRGKLNGEEIHVFVNHWPSRRSDEETEYKRVAVAKVLRNKIEEIAAQQSNPAFMIMGDFNADPRSESIGELMHHRLYNPMLQLLSPHKGSAYYKGKWRLYDQIIVSHNFFDFEPKTHQFQYANIFDRKFLREWKGRFKNSPFRTYIGNKYIGGFSDHFPVYILLKYHS